ncbi:hypothetical protein [Promicromonospora soli]
MTSDPHPTSSSTSLSSSSPPQDGGTPDDLARRAVAAVLELHIATAGPLEPASLPKVTRELRSLAILLGDIAQDLNTYSHRYSADSGGIAANENDLRTQARVTGMGAARKFAEAVELLYEASDALTQARDHSSLMADLSPSSPQATPPPTNRDRTPDPRPGRSAVVDRPDDGRSL